MKQNNDTGQSHLHIGNGVISSYVGQNIKYFLCQPQLQRVDYTICTICTKTRGKSHNVSLLPHMPM